MDFFQHLVDNLKNKVEIFGLHFASLDIRQDSSVHSAILESLSEKGNEIPKIILTAPLKKNKYSFIVANC